MNCPRTPVNCPHCKISLSLMGIHGADEFANHLIEAHSEFPVANARMSSETAHARFRTFIIESVSSVSPANQQPSTSRLKILSTQNRPRPYHKPAGFMCDFCGNWFRGEKTCEDHRRIHTGERPFECAICNTKFKQIAHLRRHLITHDPDSQRFQCNVCERKFSRNYNRSIHQRDAHPSHRFRCLHCGAIFANAEHMRDHVQINHPEQSK